VTSAGVVMLYVGNTAFCPLDVIEFDTDSVTAMPTGPQGPAGATGGNATVPLEAWHVVGAAGEPAYTNSWVNFGAPYQSVAFRRDPLGHVTLRGVLKSGVLSSSAFVLPVGFRPPAPGLYSTISNNAAGQLYIDGTNGQLIPNSGSNVWFALDGVEFDTDTVTQMPTGPRGVPLRAVGVLPALGTTGDMVLLGGNVWIDNGSAWKQLAYV
jgi:hypothetical protein